MKAITIHQPAASLIVYGQKRIETRSWRTLHRGPLAIHASGRYVRAIGLGESRALADVGLEVDDLPLGSIVGSVILTDCLESERLAKSRSLGELERALGDYGPDRYGWVLRDPVALPGAIPMLGARGLWDVDDKVMP